MNSTSQNTDETERIAIARESFSGRLLSDAQFEEAIAITRIIEREIDKAGTFKDKLGDYAYAYARSQKMDAQRAENILRDLYKERTGQTMNQTRERLMKREEALTDEERAIGYEHAVRIGERVEHGDKIAFSRAYAAEAGTMANNLGITHTAARRIMADEFEAAENVKLRDWGKELDAQHFQPQIEAEKEERARNRGASQTNSRVRDGNDAVTTDQQATADTGWDHAQGAVDPAERSTRSAVPRAGSPTRGRASRTPSGPTRSGP
jgi:hypothetical protein